MIFSVDTVIEHISQFVTLKIGDLIYTGTPAGVGSVKIGDHLEGFIGERKMFDFLVK
jgi:2-keto-4-pentenoate hydratase/2-oxohepta-3-ene-1,7-dioic acid hydratase in catechol pathway